MRQHSLLLNRRLGPSDIEVSAIGLGCVTFGDRTDLTSARAVVHRALDLGVTLFDTADKYGNRGGSEEFLGELLGHRRKDIVLASKYGLPMREPGTGGASARYTMQAVEASLKRLRTEWIDLYQVHYPDPKTPIDETLCALDDLVRQGKVRAIGCSNFSAALLTAALDGGASFITSQDHYSLLARGIENELLPTIQARGLSLLPFYPLAGGLLTGKYRREDIHADSRLARPDLKARFLTERNWSLMEKLQAVAARTGHSMLELAVGWLLSKPVVASVIAGAVTPEQIERNVAAAARIPSPAVIAEIDAITA
jgi:aryl-alcohol dehydrogenase-like predicted oxidoreductase